MGVCSVRISSFKNLHSFFKLNCLDMAKDLNSFVNLGSLITILVITIAEAATANISVAFPICQTFFCVSQILMHLTHRQWGFRFLPPSSPSSRAKISQTVYAPLPRWPGNCQLFNCLHTDLTFNRVQQKSTTGYRYCLDTLLSFACFCFVSRKFKAHHLSI